MPSGKGNSSGALTGSVVCGLAMNRFGPDGLPEALIVIFVAYLVVRIVTEFRRRAVNRDLRAP
jgi:hypothetical protein